MSDLLHTRVRLGDYSMLRSCQPLYGLATAARGFVIAGAIGWTVRIVFTMIFGREAFGAGDTHHAGFWTLDPVDGTKGFLRNQQYAIALAYIERGTPVVGVMGCPNLPRDFSNVHAEGN